MSEYDKGYQAAVDMFTKMIDDTLANQEAMNTLPPAWILKIMRVSLLTKDED